MPRKSTGKPRGRPGGQISPAQLRSETARYVLEVVFGISGSAAARLADALTAPEMNVEDKGEAWSNALRKYVPPPRIGLSRPTSSENRVQYLQRVTSPDNRLAREYSLQDAALIERDSALLMLLIAGTRPIDRNGAAFQLQQWGWDKTIISRLLMLAAPFQLAAASKRPPDAD